MAVTRHLRLARDRAVLAFVALAYALSWGTWGLGWLVLPEDVPYVPVVLLGAFGPAVAAALTVQAGGGSARAWLADALDWRVAPRCLDWRVAPRWYLLALAVPIAWYAIAALVLVAAGASLRPERAGLGVLLFLAALPVATFLAGGNEELGWRGFLLPRLQRRHDALTASLLVGGTWAGWHLPVYALPLGLTESSFHLFVPFALAASVVLTWAYNATGGSVPVAMLLHGSTNAATGLFAGVLALDAVGDATPWLARIVGAGLVAAALVVAHGPATLAPREQETAVEAEEPGAAADD